MGSVGGDERNETETVPMPENAIFVNGQLDGDKVGVTVTQKWSADDAGLAIRAGLDSCVVKGNIAFGDSENVDGECVEGFVSVMVVVYTDETFEPDNCDACSIDELTEMGGEYEFCAYRV